MIRLLVKNVKKKIYEIEDKLPLIDIAAGTPARWCK